MTLPWVSTVICHQKDLMNTYTYIYLMNILCIGRQAENIGAVEPEEEKLRGDLRAAPQGAPRMLERGSSSGTGVIGQRVMGSN